jgi:hypothetical protein
MSTSDESSNPSKYVTQSTSDTSSDSDELITQSISTGNSNMSKLSSENETVKSKAMTWLLATVDPLFFIIHITIIYVAFLLADSAVLAVINWTFGGIVKQFLFAETLLDGIKLLSALGTAAAYGLHLIYSLYQEGKHVAKAIREASKTKEALS